MNSSKPANQVSKSLCYYHSHLGKDDSKRRSQASESKVGCWLCTHQQEGPHEVKRQQQQVSTLVKVLQDGNQRDKARDQREVARLTEIQRLQRLQRLHYQHQQENLRRLRDQNVTLQQELEKLQAENDRLRGKDHRDQHKPAQQSQAKLERQKLEEELLVAQTRLDEHCRQHLSISRSTTSASRAHAPTHSRLILVWTSFQSPVWRDLNALCNVLRMCFAIVTFLLSWMPWGSPK
ncbi:hypothetical protein FALBO_6667 [Fusarium albosuccineum]|uniref:Uncharacterized protein n=1 Tax=Fusarium albosuccineum TaxID=1237068 RepID=A0A8H4P8M6_9HYPO|nr:hypothetical protein FALBO_6667 [Fusarium albosuccineum]